MTPARPDGRELPLRGPNRGTAGQLGPPDAGVSFTGLPSAKSATRIKKRSFQNAERIFRTAGCPAPTRGTGRSSRATT
jgi:hypothetical protein